MKDNRFAQDTKVGLDYFSFFQKAGGNRPSFWFGRIWIFHHQSIDKLSLGGVSELENGGFKNLTNETQIFDFVCLLMEE